MGWVIAVNQTILVIILFRPAWNGCETWTLLVDSNTTKQKRIPAFETKCLRKRLRSSYLEHKTNERVRSNISFLVGPQEPLVATVKRRNLHDSGMSHATTACQRSSFRAYWRVGHAVVGRGNAGWTTSKSGHPCPCKSCSQGPPAEKTGRGSLLNRPSRPPWRPNRSRDWPELNCIIIWSSHLTERYIPSAENQIILQRSLGAFKIKTKQGSGLGLLFFGFFLLFFFFYFFFFSFAIHPPH